MNHWSFPCYFPVISLFFSVSDPAISADVIVYTHFFADFGRCPAPFTGIYRQGKWPPFSSMRQDASAGPRTSRKWPPFSSIATGRGFVTGADLVVDGGMTRKMIYQE